MHFSDAIFRRDPRLGYEPIAEELATVIRCEDSRPFLQSMGIAGCIIPIASHSSDSICLILGNGICFVGDLEPREYLDAYEENTTLKNDRERIMLLAPKILYYAHANKKVL